MEQHNFSLLRDRVRDLSTFEPFGGPASVSPSQLESWLESVKIKPVSAMEWDWARGWIIEPRVVYDTMFFYIHKGSGKAYIGEPEVEVDFGPGDILLIPQGVKHTVHATMQEESKVYAIHFFSTLYGGIDFVKLMGFPYKLPARPGWPYEMLCQQMAREYAVKAPGWTMTMNNRLFDFLLYAIRHESGLITTQGGMDAQPLLPRLLPVLDWIDKNLDSPDITVSDLARHVYMSETHFRRLFKKLFAMSPMQFIRHRRIERACFLLRTSEMPIKQISYQCGFVEDAFFSRVFRRMVGTPPAAYRRGEYPPLES